MRFTHALRAISLATVVALAGISAFSPPVTATDPIATPAPDASTSAESPSPSASPDPAATATPAPDATPTPDAATASPDAATPSPAPDATSPAPATDPLVDPSAPSPDPSAATEALAPVATPTPSLAPVVKPKPNLRARIVRIALAQRHKPYVRGAAGPRAFDCSGLVRYAFKKAGVSRFLGGGHSARGMYRWARMHHLTSRKHPRIGDVVVWGRGSHVGIYIGKGRVVSALNPRQGIRITRLNALSAPFTTFIHVRI